MGKSYTSYEALVAWIEIERYKGLQNQETKFHYSNIHFLHHH